MKKTAQRIANAICELDNATFTSSREVRGELEPCRSKLFLIMRELGYEFAQPDSRRIRKLIHIETAASILAEMNRKQQAANCFVNISPAQLRQKTLKAMSGAPAPVLTRRKRKKTLELALLQMRQLRIRLHELRRCPF